VPDADGGANGLRWYSWKELSNYVLKKNTCVWEAEGSQRLREPPDTESSPSCSTLKKVTDQTLRACLLGVVHSWRSFKSGKTKRQP